MNQPQQENNTTKEKQNLFIEWRDKIQKWILKNRFISLVLGGVAGIVLAYFLYFLFTCLGMEVKLKNSIVLISLGLFIYILLWYFRTNDTRENIHQSDLFDALDKLTDEKVVAREIAVQRLIILSNKVSDYDETIKLAFIKVLKHFPPDNEEIKRKIWRTYAQYIITWLSDYCRKQEKGKKETEKKLNLEKCNLSFQKFKENTDFSCFKKANIAFINFKSTVFFRCNLSNIMFDNMNFENVDFLSVKLENTTFLGGDLSDANFLAPIDLSNTIFSGVNLSNTKFPSNILNSKKLESSYYHIDKPPKGIDGKILMNAEQEGDKMVIKIPIVY